MGKGYEKKYKVTRVNLGDYLILKDISQAADISMAEALHRLIVGNLKPEPAQIPVKPVFFGPKSIESNGAAAFKLKSIESNGTAAFKLKSITGNGITRLKLKSIKLKLKSIK